MVAITLTDSNPTVTKATGGGGRGASAMTDSNPTYTEGHGGGRTSVVATDLPPVFDGSRTPPGLNPNTEDILSR